MKNCVKYIDLGLPSGTLWGSNNEVKENEEIHFTFYEVKKLFKDNLPTKEQYQELIDKCSWEWTGKGYKVIGSNGNYITLPAAGFRDCDGNVYFVGSYGYYWSSTPRGSEYAYDLYFNSDKVGMRYDNRCYGQSVRLVQNRQEKELHSNLTIDIMVNGERLITPKGFVIDQINQTEDSITIKYSKYDKAN